MPTWSASNLSHTGGRLNGSPHSLLSQMQPSGRFTSCSNCSPQCGQCVMCISISNQPRSNPALKWDRPQAAGLLAMRWPSCGSGRRRFGFVSRSFAAFLIDPPPHRFRGLLEHLPRRRNAHNALPVRQTSPAILRAVFHLFEPVSGLRDGRRAHIRPHTAPGRLPATPTAAHPIASTAFRTRRTHRHGRGWRGSSQAPRFPLLPRFSAG